MANFNEESRESFSSMLLRSMWALVPFVIVTTLMGGYYIHSIGALTMPDAGIHARGAYALATGQFLNPVSECVDVYGNRRALQVLNGDSRFLLLEGASNKTVSEIIDGSFPQDPSREVQIAACARDGYETSFPDDVTETPGPSDASPNNLENVVYNIRGGNQYFPLVYLPQAVGMRIGLCVRGESMMFGRWDVLRTSYATSSSMGLRL